MQAGFPGMGSDLEAAIDVIRTRVSILERQRRLPFLIDHGVHHADRVAQNVALLAAHSAATPNALTKEEWFLAGASCYLHDVALEWSTSQGKTDALGLDDLTSIRARHPEMIANWITQTLDGENERFPDLMIPNLGLRESNVPEYLLRELANVCRMQAPVDSSTGTRPTSRSNSIRVPLVAALVRVADILDLNQSRVRTNELDRWRLDPDESLLAFVHLYTSSVSVDKTGGVRLSMHFPAELTVVEIQALKGIARNRIEHALSQTRDVLRENEIFPQLLQIEEAFSPGNERVLPIELKNFIGSAKDNRTPLLPPTVSGHRSPQKKAQSWVSYWGFRGNPWNDLPISYSDAEFVETSDTAEKLDELDSLLAGQKGEVRLVFGKRGAGKTSLLSTVRDRYASKAIISYYDFSRIDAPMTTATQLHAWVFPKILRDLTNKESNESTPTAEDFRKAMDEFHVKKPIVLIDNLDRYSETADLRLIKQFFQLAQGNLQAMKRKSIILISSTDEWKQDLAKPDLSYLGKSSFWDIKPFTQDEVKELIQRRLKIAGSDYDQVFDRGAARILHKMSAGNPRRVLDACALLSKEAAKEGLEKITESFVELYFGHELQNKTKGLIVQASRHSEPARAGFELVYSFYLGAERAGALSEEAWRLFIILFEKSMIAVGDVPEKLVPAFSKIAVLKSRVDKSDADRERMFWVPNPAVKEFARALKDQGLKVDEFASFYKNKPVVPQGADHEAILQAIAAAQLTEDIRVALDRANRAYEDSQRTSATPVKSLMKARWCLEYLLVAYLLKRNVQLPPQYIRDHEEGRFLSNWGQPRQKFPWKCMVELRDLVALFDAHKDRYVQSYREMKLIQTRSEDYFRDPNFGASLTSTDAKILSNAISKVFHEFSAIIVNK